MLPDRPETRARRQLVDATAAAIDCATTAVAVFVGSRAANASESADMRRLALTRRGQLDATLRELTDPRKTLWRNDITAAFNRLDVAGAVLDAQPARAASTTPNDAELVQAVAERLTASAEG